MLLFAHDLFNKKKSSHLIFLMKHYWAWNIFANSFCPLSSPAGESAFGVILETSRLNNYEIFGCNRITIEII